MINSEFLKKVPFMDSLQIKDAMSIEINFVQLNSKLQCLVVNTPPPPHFIKKQEITLHK